VGSAAHPKKHEFTFLSLASGIGGGALGLAQATAKLGHDTATFKDLGGVDFWPKALEAYRYLTDAPTLCADLHELQPAQLRAFAGERRPDLVITSSPCKGFSALMNAETAATPKYQKMNELVLRSIMLAIETWPESPPPLFVLENVPRITQRGADLLERARKLLWGYGYATHEDTHDLGEAGNLAAHRERFVLVARLRSVVPAYVYQVPKRRVRACGEVLNSLPMPNNPHAGPLHTLPDLKAKTQVRLAWIPPGGDWRDLPKKDEAPCVELIGPLEKGQKRRSVFRREKVNDTHQPAPVVVGAGGNAADRIADEQSIPKVLALKEHGKKFRGSPGLYGVLATKAPGKTVTANQRVSSGNTPAAVADERILAAVAVHQPENVHSNRMPVLDTHKPSRVVTSADRVGSGMLSLADAVALNPHDKRYNDSLGVTDPAKPAYAIRANPSVQSSRAALASIFPPEQLALGCSPRAGNLGVISWMEAAKCLVANADVNSNTAAIADPRPTPYSPIEGLSLAEVLAGIESYDIIIRSAWDTWNRAMTPLEMAVLQGFPAVHKGKPLELPGGRGDWVEMIGNAIPVQAATAIGGSFLKALIASATGQWFALSQEAIWVRKDGVREDDARFDDPASSWHDEGAESRFEFVEIEEVNHGLS
jgi:site-specific DNA-cytosine methylase